MTDCRRRCEGPGSRAVAVGNGFDAALDRGAAASWDLEKFQRPTPPLAENQRIAMKMRQNSSPFLMNKLLICIAGVVLVCFICLLCRRESNIANIVHEGNLKNKLELWTHSWQMPIGADGPQNMRRVEPCSAALLGAGPVFTNPPFHDYYGRRYNGIITFDAKHGIVLVDLYRMETTSGGVISTNLFSGNGSYAVKSIRDARPFEREIFDHWITNGDSEASMPFNEWLKKSGK